MITKHFPTAQSAIELNQRITFTLIKEGSRRKNTLFAASVCPDEINHYPNSLNNRLSRGAGKCFYMGGLAGIPFIGKVGYNAFTSHMPVQGNLVILFSPHIGVTPDGEFGKFAREGQDTEDNACGAAIAAFRWLQTNDWEPQNDKEAKVQVPNDTDTFDYQFVYIRESLKPYFAEIEQSEEPMVALAYALYKISEKYVSGMVEAIPDVKVSIIGGIQINVHRPCGDLFMPLMFKVL